MVRQMQNLICEQLLFRIRSDGRVITGDETWILMYDPRPIEKSAVEKGSERPMKAKVSKS